MSAVYEAITGVIGDLVELGGIKKAGRNNSPGASYFFRGVDQLYNALAPILVERKLVIFPRVIEHKQEVRESNQGKALYFTFIKVEFDFVSSIDGSKHTVATVGEAMDSSDKSSNKAMSAAFKYACFMTFCIPIDIVTLDADAESPQAKFKPTGKTRHEEVRQEPEPQKVWDNNATAEFMNQIAEDDDVNLHAKVGVLLKDHSRIGDAAKEMARAVLARRSEVVNNPGAQMAMEKSARLMIAAGLITLQEFLTAANVVRSRMNCDLINK